MGSPTSLSAFLEGVNFMEEDALHLDELEEEDTFLCEDGFMLDDMDMNMNMDMDVDVDRLHMQFLEEDDAAETSSLPPLDMIDMEENDADLAALMVGGTSSEDDGDCFSSCTGGASLEKLAECMRQSEMALRKQQSILAKRHSNASVSTTESSTSSSSFSSSSEPVLPNHNAFVKASSFFNGGRLTISPELEQSRQKLWSMIQQSQQQQKKQWNPPTTAAA